jgi:serine/threonine-protein kinase
MVATALAHINQPPPQLPDTVPAGIRDLIGAALAKDPADRPAGAAAMARALRMPAAVSSGGDVTRTQVIPIGAAALSAPAKGSLPARVRPARRRTAIILGAATAIAIGVLAAFALPDGGNDLRAPAVIATTPPTSSLPDQTLTSATLSTNAASVAAPPANTSPSPGQLDRPRGKARSHDDNKDGKK